VYVWVTNKNAFDVADKFDGVDYSYPKGKRVKVLDLAADLHFGYKASVRLKQAESQHTPEKDLIPLREAVAAEASRCLSRHMWNMLPDGKARADGRSILANFQIDPYREPDSAVA